MINIRPAKLDDAVSMAYIMRSLSHFYLDHNTPDIPDWLLESSSVSEFERRLVNQDFKSFVYTLPGRKADVSDIIGFISIKLFPERVHVQSLFVMESEQRRGVARELWRTVLSECSAEYYTVRSSVYAVPVYRAFGFIEQGGLQDSKGVRFQNMRYTNN